MKASNFLNSIWTTAPAGPQKPVTMADLQKAYEKAKQGFGEPDIMYVYPEQYYRIVDGMHKPTPIEELVAAARILIEREANDLK